MVVNANPQYLKIIASQILWALESMAPVDLQTVAYAKFDHGAQPIRIMDTAMSC